MLFTYIINYFYRISIPDTGFSETASLRALNSWIHLTIVFRSLIDGEGFFFYFNGQLIGIETTADDRNSPSTGDLPSKMTLGSQYPDVLEESDNIMLVDEIILWNGKLDDVQIRQLAACINCEMLS